jgi:DNA topoisomerase-1
MGMSKGCGKGNPTSRLRRVDCAGPGITRRRRGRGFEYVDESGERIAEEEVIERIRSLAIPPAWADVWICADPMGHIQATGLDDAGRKQYRYHDLWRERRDRAKFDSMVDFARALPKLRKQVEKDLRRRVISRERVLACAVRLLDRGFFRIGGEDYAEENETYGVATMRKRHVTVRGDTVDFDYEAKGGARRMQVIGDAGVARLVRRLKARRGGGYELLAYKEERGWRDVRSEDINEYLKGASGHEHSAKDFRTWNATVLAAVVLAVQARDDPPETSAGRNRAKRIAVKEVARFLGNTPAVCRASYIDPRVFDRFDGGLAISGVFERLPDDPADWPEVQGPIERAVLDLIARRESPAIEEVAA